MSKVVSDNSVEQGNVCQVLNSKMDRQRQRPGDGGVKRKHKTHANAAVAITLPNNEKEETLNYLDEYSCWPPPLLMIALSLSQVHKSLFKSSKRISFYPPRLECLSMKQLCWQRKEKVLDLMDLSIFR